MRRNTRVEDDHVIETLSADRADQALDEPEQLNVNR
jgi:hypothetical protein